MVGQQLVAGLEMMLLNAPLDFLFVDNSIPHGVDAFTMYMRHFAQSLHISVSSAAHVAILAHSSDHSAASPRTGYFSGVFPSSRGEKIVGFKFDGNRIDPAHVLLIVANVYERGTYFNALCSVLESHFGRNFDNRKELQNLGFFRQVKKPVDDPDPAHYFLRQSWEVADTGILVGLGRDRPLYRWGGYVPIVDGRVIEALSPIVEVAATPMKLNQ